MKKLLLAVLLWCVPAFAQFVPQPAGSYVNSGSGWAAATSTSTFDAATFTPQPIGLYRLNTTLNQWVPWDGGSSSGAGTVLSFSAGNLSPLFTTSVATSTTTPALTFLLSNAPGKSILGNVSATSGAPAYTTDPQVLTLTANSITSATVTGALLGNANTATSLAGGAALGDLPYQSAAGTTAMLAGRTAATLGILCQIGNGTISAAPVWCATTGTGTTVPLSVSPTFTGMVTSARFASNQVTGTSPFTVASTTPVVNLVVANHPTELYCGTTTTCSNTAATGGRIVYGSVQLAAGVAVVTGISPAFADTNYSCSGSIKTGVTVADGFFIANTSTSSITITGVGTDTISYQCVR